MYTFNKELLIKNMKPYVDELFDSLRKEGISIENDERLENIIFTKDKTIFKVAYHCFYRFTGSCKMIKPGKGKNEIEWIDIPDKMHISSVMGSIIRSKFGI